MGNAPDEATLTDAIADATRLAVSDLFRRHPTHRFYYCTLTTTSEGHAPVLTAWSEEALLEVADGDALFAQRPEPDYNEKRAAIVVAAEFMPPDFTNTERVRRLNPPEALTRWLAEAAESK